MPETHISDVKVPLPWEEAVRHREVAKEKAARQFLAIWQANKDRHDVELRWGEEIEYMLVDIDGQAARAALCADEVLRRLGAETGGDDPTRGAGWRTEYGNMMVEGVTHPPFSWALEAVLQIEPALAWRRRELERMAAESVLCPDEVTSPHPRYQTFTANYRKRKGCKVAAFIPREGISDEERLTPQQVSELPFRLASEQSRERDPVPGHIYMDSQAFGAGQCCTQATFLCRSLEEARYLTDQFLVLAPLFLALTAATPFLRGLVADTDTRWETFIQTWDDRHSEEISKVRNSRTSANDLFIGTDLVGNSELEGKLNDVPVQTDGPALETLLHGGVDPVLAKHVAHLLLRDPLMVFEDKLDIDDNTAADHWEQLQGTNWGNVRFKPPPCAGDIGWRVEFRSPEVQLTDFENAAICAVVRVLAEVILDERWDLTIPVSCCDANDAASAARKAAPDGLFWFRDSVSGTGPVEQRPLHEILSAEGGLFTRARRWLDAGSRCSPEVRAKLERYLQLFERRAAGELPTPATFLRARLRAHPANKGDGVLPEQFVYDLCCFAAELNRPGAEWPVELLGAAP